MELGELADGGSKNETRFGQIGQQKVVVKIQREHGQLKNEARALRFLVAHDMPVPRVIGSGVTCDGRWFLTISHEDGVRTITPEGWNRLGRDLASLLDVPVAGCTLTRVTTVEFIAEHRERLELVRALVNDGLADAIGSAITRIESVRELVVTHEDPGSGNYLDRETSRGTLLDWETAAVAPFGIDLGRAAFIGLLDLWQSGIPNQLVAALIQGYRTGSPVASQMSDELMHAWITIGGLQFIHGRYTQPLLPERTPQVAANVLEAYLRSRQ